MDLTSAKPMNVLPLSQQQALTPHVRLTSGTQTGFVFPWFLVCCLGLFAGLPGAQGQTTLLTEGFEGAFPGNWSTGDANATGTPAYWKDEPNTFGTLSAHTGSWKGYCAGIGFGGTSTAPLYQNYMQGFMSQTVNLAGYSGANLSFWYNIPSIETNFDSLRVYMDST